MRFFVYITLIAALLFSFVPAQAMLADTVVEPANPNGWVVVDDNGKVGGMGDFVTGPATPPAGTGSAHLVLTQSDAGWIFSSKLNPGTKIADLTTLKYSTYVTASSSVAPAVALSINVDYDVTDGTPAYQGRLVYEPYLNGTVKKGEWQEWNANLPESKWFATGLPGMTICPMSSPCPLSTILTAHPNIGFIDNPIHRTINFKAGSGWASFDGNFDKLVVGVNGVDQTFDFEPSAEEASSTVYVDDDFVFVYEYQGTEYILPLPLYADPDGSGPAKSMGYDASVTVQGGVDIVAAGGTVNVADGTYTEQVLVNNMDGLTIVGAGEEAVSIIAPADILVTTVNNKDQVVNPVVFVGESVNVTIKDLTVDGAGTGNTNNILHGIHYRNSSGLVEYVTITAVRHAELTGDQGGNGFYGHNADGNERTITVRESTVVDYQKNGITFLGAGLTANVDKNVVTGAGETGVIAQNGIQIGGGTHGVLTGNTVTKHQYTGTSWASSGILVVDKSTADVSNNVVTDNMIGIASDLSTASIEQNYVTRNQWGIAVNGGEADIIANKITSNEYGVDVYTFNATYTAVATITHNRFFNNDYGVANEIAVATGEVAPTLDAVDNWWGCNEGPTNTIDCDGIYGGVGSQPVNASTWLKLTLTADQTHVIDGRPANLLATITTNSAGVDVTDIAPFPDGKDIDFTNTAGLLDGLLRTDTEPLGKPMVVGSAGAVLTVDPWASMENATISAKLDNETVTVNLLTGLLHFWLPVLHNAGN